MARAVVLFFLIVAVATISAYPQGSECGVNEVFSVCGSACPPSCAQPSSQICTLACKVGCECVEGYVRNALNQCVLTQSC